MPNGISFTANNTPTPITVTLQPGVQVIAGAPTGTAVNLANSTPAGSVGLPGADVTLTANSASITNISNPNSSSRFGVLVQSNGNATVTATDTQIVVLGLQGGSAIDVGVLPSAVLNPVARIDFNGTAANTATVFSTVLMASNFSTGPAIINAAGNITGVALGSAANGISGLFASAGGGGAMRS